MKKQLSKMLSILFVLCMLFPQTVKAGSNLTISTADGLYAFASQVNAGDSYEGMVINLTADIWLNGSVVNEQGGANSGNFVEWIPIGTEQTPFKGVFNGNGHTINGLYINNEGQFQGLFGNVSGATICNTTVKDSYIAAKAHAGAIAGCVKDGSTVNDCHSSNCSIYTKKRSGGVVGWIADSKVYNCSSSGLCYSDRCSGGIAGDIYSGGKIYNCYSAANVGGKELFGGIVGGSTKADIQNCVMVGSVLDKKGHLIEGDPNGQNISVSNCYALQNATINAGLTVGASTSTARVFSDVNAAFSDVLVYKNGAYTDAVSALNAWISAQNDGVAYRPWGQQGSYPYFQSHQ